MRLGLMLIAVVACTDNNGTGDDQPSETDDPTDDVGTDTDPIGDTDETDTDVPPENVCALFDEAVLAGRYPLNL